MYSHGARPLWRGASRTRWILAFALLALALLMVLDAIYPW
jgi:hypothetical protein